MPIDFDFTPYFEKYLALVEKVDQVFDQVRGLHPEEVRCQIGCADCCHALFDLSLIEALYINSRFLDTFQGLKQERLLERANRADRDTYRIKRQAYRELQAGKSEEEVLNIIASQRVRCAMLDDEDRCEIYRFRPITCRVYGVPASIRGTGRTCGLTGFQPGVQYPTVNLDAIYQQLYRISAEMVADMKSRHIKMAEILVPLSMALLTSYDETYLGVGEEDSEAAAAEEKTKP
jgi:Fe-S-cluster containining protein